MIHSMNLSNCTVLVFHTFNYHQTSNISRTLVGNKRVYHSDVVGASPVGAAPTTQKQLQDETRNISVLGFDAPYIFISLMVIVIIVPCPLARWWRKTAYRHWWDCCRGTLLCSHVHYSDVIMSLMASQITSFAIVYSTVCSGGDRWPVNSPHKGQWRGKCFHLMTS